MTNRANTHAASQSEAGTEMETGTEWETAPQARVKLIKANAAQPQPSYSYRTQWWPGLDQSVRPPVFLSVCPSVRLSRSQSVSQPAELPATVCRPLGHHLPSTSLTYIFICASVCVSVNVFNDACAICAVMLNCSPDCPSRSIRRRHMSLRAVSCDASSIVLSAILRTKVYDTI